jgi:Ca2+-binding EF-hand superfamily protein
MNGITSEFEQLDHDNDGFVDFKEFVAMVAEIFMIMAQEVHQEECRF